MKTTLPVPTAAEIHAEYDRKIRSIEEWRALQLARARIDRASATERADHERATRRSVGMEAGLADQVWLNMIEDAERAFRRELDRITVRFSNLATDAANDHEIALFEIGIEAD